MDQTVRGLALLVTWILSHVAETSRDDGNCTSDTSRDDEVDEEESLLMQLATREHQENLVAALDGLAQSQSRQASTAEASEVARMIDLMAGMKLRPTVLGKDIEVELTTQRSTWLALGFSNSDSTSMTGDGKGVEVYACTGGVVLRYWVLQYDQPTGGVAAPNSSCSHVSGKTTMKFHRTLAASLPNSVAVTPGAGQILIYAHGRDSQTSWHYHDGMGGKNIDLGTLRESKAAGKKARAPLYLHLIFMTLAWGTLIPWGVAIANRTRKVAGAPEGAWFKQHRLLVSAGLLSQLLGMVMAIWHVADMGTAHFDGFHKILGLIVAFLGFSQPVIAVVRNFVRKPQAGEPKSRGRFAWELIHKSVGYAAMFFGIVNVVTGVMLLRRQDYDTTVIVIAAVLAAFGLFSVLLYFLLSLYDQNNLISNMCVGADRSETKSINGGVVGADTIGAKA